MTDLPARPGGWRVKVETALAFDGVRLDAVRRNGEAELDVLMHSDLQFHTVLDGSRLPDDAGLLVPRGLWVAIVDAVDPRPHANEVRRLEEALTVERARVDQVIGDLLR